MIYGSVCSGIEAASVAWHPLGWRASFLSEIEAFPRAVLAHHYPDTPLHGDFTTIAAGQYDPIDLLVGGTPCQSFSIAGLRGGLDDDRGNLALEYLRLADRLRPRWLVWENVPGVLSSNGGRDFGAILGGMVELGYGFAYRVLDAQFLGVAQRRRRVFVVGYLGDWRRAAAVLFERHSLSGNPAPRREARKDLAPTISARPTGGGGLGTDFDLDGGCVVTAPTMRAGGNRTGGDRPYGTDVDTCDSLIVSAYRVAGDGAAYHEGDATAPLTTGTDSSASIVAHAIQAGALRENPKSGPDGVGVQEGVSYTLEARSEVQAVAFSIMPMNSGKDFKGRETDVAQPVMAAGPAGGNQGGDDIVQPAVAFAQNTRDEVREMPYVGALAAEPGMKQTSYIRQSSAVRRLTPRECERLQGFPDDYTLIPYRKGQAADGPRYKALGNSMAVPVMSWIGRRIAAVDALPIQSERTAA